MHIALCDDNVADRKQFERLIKKESVRRAAEQEGIFLDAFGSAASLLANPMQYDVFFIDQCLTPDVTGSDIAGALLSRGITVPIVLCCSKINYRQETFPDNVIFMDKPIKAGELSSVLDYALHILEQAVPPIELRAEENTCYLTEPDILYAIEKGGRMEVHLKSKDILFIRDNARNLFSQLGRFPVFFCPTSKVILNGRYLTRVGHFRIEMADGSTFRITRDILPYAEQVFSDFHGST
ncbi:MAG: hypothetical protein ACI4HQ_06835 [Acetatifactor sp.]